MWLLRSAQLESKLKYLKSQFSSLHRIVKLINSARVSGMRLAEIFGRALLTFIFLFLSCSLAQPNLANAQLAEGSSDVWVETVWSSGPSTKRLDFVILSEGYQIDERDKFNSSVGRVVEALFKEEPFRSYSGLINIHSVFKASSDSGSDNDPTQGIQRETVLDSRFWCQGSQRALCIDIPKTKALAGYAPEADQTIVSVNSQTYGGVGYINSDIATFSGGNPSAVELLLHELGHSFGNLADEYQGGYGQVYQGSEVPGANVSVMSLDEIQESERKWSHWIGADLGAEYDGAVSAFEGALGYGRGVFRASKNSKMRSLGRPFNLPSIEAMIFELYKRASLIDSHTPNSTPVWSDSLLMIAPSITEAYVEWSLSGESESEARVLDSRGESFLDLSTLELEPGSYTIVARVIDPTKFVRDEARRDELLTETIEWTLLVGEDADNQSAESSLDSRCSFPNGFLNQVNILNLSNSSEAAASAQVSLYAEDGSLSSQTNYLLAPFQKLDISLFDLGLQSDTVGTVCLVSESVELQGALSLYAPSDIEGQFKFALRYPLQAPQAGSATLAINTFNLLPGLPGAFNWVRIIDGSAGDGEGLSGLLSFYNESGQRIASRQISLPDSGRIDIAGHEFLATNSYGLVSFEADDGAAEFFFEVSRYFPDLNGGINSAVNFYPQVSDKKVASYNTSAGESVSEVVEIVNYGEVGASVLIIQRNPDGQTFSKEKVYVEAMGSFHYIVQRSAETRLASASPTSLDAFDALSLLESSGSIVLVTDSEGVKSRMVSYAYDEGGFFGSAAKFSKEENQDYVMEFNTFLEQSNCVSAYNPNTHPISVSVEIRDAGGEEIGREILEIPAKGSGSFPIEVSSDRYGTVTLKSKDSFSSDSFTLKPSDFIFAQ